MKTGKISKRALILSGLSLLLCITMFVGSTYAWFSDSVTSGGNIIQSGTLDVAMKWADGTTDPNNTTWTDASDGPIFYYERWEPGYTEVRHIAISNEGTLALQYRLNIAANGNVSELADVIDVYYMDPAKQISDRGELSEANKLGTLSEVLTGLAGTSGTAGGVLIPRGESAPSLKSAEIITIALQMRQTAGDEYQNKSIGSSFSVQLLATQWTYEADSFDKTYDNSAKLDSVSSLDELKARRGAAAIITDNVDVTQDAGITVTNPLFVGSLAIIAGKTLTVPNFALVVDQYGAVVSGSISSAANPAKKTGINSYGLVVMADNVSVKGASIRSGVSVGGSAGETPGARGAKNVLIEDCDITAGDYYAVCAQMGSTVTIRNTTVRRAETSDSDVKNRALFAYDGLPADWGEGTNILTFENVKVYGSSGVYGNLPGVTVTDNGDGSYTLNGTVTATVAP